MSKEFVQWHPILQNILDDYMPLLSGKRIKSGDRESSRYIKIDYYVETDGDLPAEELRKDIIRPLNHLKARNVIEYKSLHQTLDADLFRHYMMRALAVEAPKEGTSYRGEVTLTIFTTRLHQQLFGIKKYKFEKLNPWKWRSHWDDELDIYVLVQREMRGIDGGEALALLQVLEGNPEKQKTVWLDLFSQELDNTNVLRKIAEEISKETVMTLVEQLRKEGEIKGKKEGKIEGKKETAVEMLKDGVKIKQIVKFTKLTEEEVLKLKAELDTKKE